MHKRCWAALLATRRRLLKTEIVVFAFKLLTKVELGRVSGKAKFLNVYVVRGRNPD